MLLFAQNSIACRFQEQPLLLIINMISLITTYKPFLWEPKPPILCVTEHMESQIIFLPSVSENFRGKKASCISLFCIFSRSLFLAMSLKTFSERTYLTAVLTFLFFEYNFKSKMNSSHLCFQSLFFGKNWILY